MGLFAGPYDRKAATKTDFVAVALSENSALAGGLDMPSLCSMTPRRKARVPTVTLPQEGTWLCAVGQS